MGLAELEAAELSNVAGGDEATIAVVTGVDVEVTEPTKGRDDDGTVEDTGARPPEELEATDDAEPKSTARDD